MPMSHFEELGIAVRVMNPDFAVNGNTIIAGKACSHYNLRNITISIGALEYRIPQIYYAQTTPEKFCRLLVEPQ